MNYTAVRALCCVLFAYFGLALNASGQGIAPYPNATTDRLIHNETPMALPPRNVVFTDPDFGSKMVRATDGTTNFKRPGTYIRTEASGQANEWSSDGKKFYVLGSGGQVLVYDFNPSTMAITSPPTAKSGQPLLVPLNPGPTFAFTNPDLIYGTTGPEPLAITSYQFSTGVSTPVIDTRTCGVQPPLGMKPAVTSDTDVSLSMNDGRVSISEGGPQNGKHMFVVVYDKKLGCRWYNTQTGQIGGQWGKAGSASLTDSYLIRHAYLTGNGKYVHILTDVGVWYMWNIASLQVTSCALGAHEDCAGYGVTRYGTYVNGPGVLDDLQIDSRPVNNLVQITPLMEPLPSPAYWGEVPHFTASNMNAKDTTPACLSTYEYDGDPGVDQPFWGEIFCVEDDGLGSTVWRFAHNRAQYIDPYFQTQPLGNISRNGKFFLFTSNWDGQLGYAADGTALSDVFIVKLD